MIGDTPRIETRAWRARLTRKRAMPARSLLPLHLHYEEGLVRRRLPGELAPGGVDREVLVEPDARHVLLEDGEGLAVVLEPLVVLQRLPGPRERVVDGGVRILRPEARERGQDPPAPLLAGPRPSPERDAAGLLGHSLPALQEGRLVRLGDGDLEPDL